MSGSKRVVFVAHDFPDAVGGPYSWLSRLLPALRERAIEPHALVFTEGPPQACPNVGMLRAAGIAVEAIAHPGTTERATRWLLERVASVAPDVVVPNLSIPAFHTVPCLKRAGIPTVGVVRSDDDFHEALVDEFVRGDPERRVSAVVCVSRFLEERLRALAPADVLIRRIPSGTPLPASSVEPPRGPLRFAYVGRLEQQQKRARELAEALCRLTDSLPGSEAFLFGSGSARAEVEEVLAARRTAAVHPPVRLRPDEVQQRLQSMHVFVLLSDYEGLPTALVEAMACGVVPICLRIRSGVPDVVEDGVTGLLVDDREESLVAAARRLDADRALWERLSRAARATVERGYSTASAADRWAALCEELVHGAEDRGPLVIPRHLDLPPVRAALAAQDRREARAPVRVLVRGWRAARGWLGIGAPARER